MTGILSPGVAARAHRATESLHSLIYFAPEAAEELTGVGLRPGSMPYFASRSAAMGAVSGGVTAATFYNFNPAMVARHIPRAWTLAAPQIVLAARWRAVDRALRRLLGDAIGSTELVELAGLAAAACEPLRPEGRPLYAAHAGLDRPDEPHLLLWHAATLLREFRGDGHLAALLDAQLSGIESIVTHCATGRGFTEDAARLLRGWSDEQWAEAKAGLAARGLMSGDELTEAGRALRTAIEDRTDRLDDAAWRQLGEQRTARLIELGKAFTRIVVAGGAFPADTFAAAPS
jgi:helix-turn-helix protein